MTDLRLPLDMLTNPWYPVHTQAGQVPWTQTGDIMETTRLEAGRYRIVTNGRAYMVERSDKCMALHPGALISGWWYTTGPDSDVSETSTLADAKALIQHLELDR